MIHKIRLYMIIQIYIQKKEYIYNLNYEYVISTKVESKYSFTRSGRGLFENVANKLFSEKEDGYYFEYSNETPNLSVALGVKHYSLALDTAKDDVDLAIRLYTLGHFERDPEKLKGKDDYVNEVFGARDGTIEY